MSESKPIDPTMCPFCGRPMAETTIPALERLKEAAVAFSNKNDLPNLTWIDLHNAAEAYAESRKAKS